jgi:hypothetical protein
MHVLPFLDMITAMVNGGAVESLQSLVDCGCGAGVILFNLMIHQQVTFGNTQANIFGCRTGSESDCGTLFDQNFVELRQIVHLSFLRKICRKYGCK